LASTGEAAGALATIERHERDVDARLQALLRAVPAARAFAGGVARDRARHRRQRADVRRWLRLGPPVGAGGGEPPADASLEGLRTAQQALVHAHAEGLPVLGDARAVHRLGAHLVDLARHLAVVEMWMEMEEDRG
jgi:hypothetical protein